MVEDLPSILHILSYQIEGFSYFQDSIGAIFVSVWMFMAKDKISTRRGRLAVKLTQYEHMFYPKAAWVWLT